MTVEVYRSFSRNRTIPIPPTLMVIGLPATQEPNVAGGSRKP